MAPFLLSYFIAKQGAIRQICNELSLVHQCCILIEFK